LWISFDRLIAEDLTAKHCELVWVYLVSIFEVSALSRGFHLIFASQEITLDLESALSFSA
jgi:hypothetical protein